MSTDGSMTPKETVAQKRLLDRIREDRLVTRRDYLRILVTVSGGLLAGTAAVASGLFRRLVPGDAPPKRVAETIEPGSAAVVIVYENAWAAPFAHEVRRNGGELVAYHRITVQELAEALDAVEAAA